MLTEKQKEILEIAENKNIKKDYYKICFETLTCPDCGEDLEFYKDYSEKESRYFCDYCNFVHYIDRYRGSKDY